MSHPLFTARQNQLFSEQTDGKYNLRPPANVRSASRNNHAGPIYPHRDVSSNPSYRDGSKLPCRPRPSHQHVSSVPPHRVCLPSHHIRMRLASRHIGVSHHIGMSSIIRTHRDVSCIIKSGCVFHPNTWLEVSMHASSNPYSGMQFSIP